MKGNARECQGNVWEWVQSARGMLGNAGECQGKVWEWMQTARGMQENARGTDGSECKVPGECRRMTGI